MEGSDGTCEDTEDATMIVQIEEAKCAIRTMSYVTKLSPVRAVNGMDPGWQTSLSFSRCKEYEKSMAAVQRSKDAKIMTGVQRIEIQRACQLSKEARTSSPPLA
jgi:hypothetical protein